MILRLHYHAHSTIVRPDSEIGVFTDLGTLVTKFSTWIDYQSRPSHLEMDTSTWRSKCLTLLPGRYFLTLWVKIRDRCISTY